MEVSGRQRVHEVFGLVAVLLCALFVSGPGVPRMVAILLASLIPAILLPVLLVRRRATRSVPWWLVVGGLVSLTVHNVNTLVQVGFQGLPTATGLVPLILVPLGYLCLLAAAALIAFPYALDDTGGIIDAVIVALGAASLVWAFAVDPALMAREAGLGDRLYTLGIFLLISGIAGALTRARVISREARPALDLLLLAILVTLVGNVVKAITQDPATGASAWWNGLLWIVGYLSLAAAASHPTQAHLGTAGVHGPGRLTGRRLVFLGAVLALNPVLAGTAEAAGGHTDWLLLMAVTVALVPMVIVRIAQLARLHADAERRLEHLASHDELTGVANRRRVMTRLEDVLAQVRAGTAPGAVLLFLDLDDFKVVNDEHGHPVGDQLLVTVAHRLLGAVRAEDTVARFGGDEFIVLCLGEPDDVGPLAVRRIEQALAAPARLGHLTVPCHASIGVAQVRPAQGLTADQLLSAADADMYEHKRLLRAGSRVVALSGRTGDPRLS